MPFSAFFMTEHQLHLSTATTHQYNASGQLSQRRAASAAEIEIQNSLLLSPLMVDLVSDFSDFPSFF